MVSTSLLVAGGVAVAAAGAYFVFLAPAADGGDDSDHTDNGVGSGVAPPTKKVAEIAKEVAKDYFGNVKSTVEDLTKGDLGGVAGSVLRNTPIGIGLKKATGVDIGKVPEKMWSGATKAVDDIKHGNVAKGIEDLARGSPMGQVADEIWKHTDAYKKKEAERLRLEAVNRKAPADAWMKSQRYTDADCVKRFYEAGEKSQWSDVEGLKSGYLQCAKNANDALILRKQQEQQKQIADADAALSAAASQFGSQADAFRKYYNSNYGLTNKYDTAAYNASVKKASTDFSAAMAKSAGVERDLALAGKDVNARQAALDKWYNQELARAAPPGIYTREAARNFDWRVKVDGKGSNAHELLAKVARGELAFSDASSEVNKASSKFVNAQAFAANLEKSGDHCGAQSLRYKYGFGNVTADTLRKECKFSTASISGLDQERQW